MIGKSMNERWTHRGGAHGRQHAKVQRRIEQALGNVDVSDEIRHAVTETIEAGPAEAPTIAWRVNYGR
jgi:hypothetical protein